jgi:uncharacterized membrane protein
MPDNARVSRDRRGVRVPALILATTAVTMLAGWLVKAPCLGSWADGRQYNRLCYSDVAALYASDDRDRGLDEGRFPYVDGENEYPVLTGVAMWAASLPADSHASFFNWTAILLTGAALATAWFLYRLVGTRALLFALAPTVVVYGLINWDLLAVALATAATFAHLRDRDRSAGLLIGLGAAAKLYPALLVIPFALGRLRQNRPGDAGRLAGTAVLTWVAVNLPFAVLGSERWSEFFRFNGARNADWDSVWFLVARHLGFTWNVPVLNALAAASFAVAIIAIWKAVGGRPGFQAWTFGFPVLAVFLLTSKVYSPQYGLWLLPWFALSLPDARLFAAFQAAEIAVFVTRFQFFASYQGVGPGLPFWSFELAVILRAAILVGCIAIWVRNTAARRHEPVPEPATAPA